MALVQATRESINDRFSVLSFTVRSEDPLVEIAIAAQPELLQSANRTKRNGSNFFTSKLLSATRRGESIYLVPPDVVARFVGQPRLYFGFATYKEGDRSHPVSVKIPTAGSMYVDTSGLTERGLRRTARGNGRASYGNGKEGLAWGGDAVEATPVSGNGSSATKAPATAAPYSDGYPDDLWKQHEAAPQPVPASTPPATSAQSWRPSLPGRARARELLVGPFDSSSSWWDELKIQLGHFARGAMWFLGVLDTTKPPYSAICQVRVPDGSAEGRHLGSAFFIGPRLILTAAHVVEDQTELIIVPGKNGGGMSSTTEPFGRFRVTQFAKHPSYGVNGRDNDMGLICVPASNAASAPNYFSLVEELTQSRPEGVVVSGYAAWWYATSAIEELVNKNIDENRQHAHGGHIREIPTDGTFSYDLQTLAGTSGSPVYWIEDSATPTAHLVGVHVAAHDNKTNLGCRITQEKLKWIRDQAAAWGQTLTFSLAARALDETVPALAEEDPDAIGIGEDEPVATTQAYRPRALEAPPAPDYPGASRFVPAHSRNYTKGRRRDIAVDRVVIHITAGGPKIEGTIAWFQNGDRVNERTGKPIRSSSHYIVGRDGEVVQLVRNADTAHHASQANWRSIGIEHNANKPSRGNKLDLPPTQAQYEASARLVAWLCQQLGIPADREHIRGHMEISPADDHDCPSSYWDWDYYMACVQSAVAALAAPTSQGLALRRRTARALRQEVNLAQFDVPAEMEGPEFYVKQFIEAFNTRGDNADAKKEALFRVSQIADALKTDSGRTDIGRAILWMATAGGLQVFRQIENQLPPTFYAPFTTDVNEPLPPVSETVSMPRVMPFLSQRVGMFMAWVDAAIQQATSDTRERLGYQKSQWDTLGVMVGAGSTLMGMVPGLGTAMTFIGVALQGIISAFTPDFEAEYASFEAAMQKIRERYKALAGAVLEGFIHAKFGGPEVRIISIPLHPDVQAYIDAHSAHALKGWQNELIYLGLGAPATGLSLGLRRMPLSRAQEIITPFYDPADAATALTCQADAFSLAREEWFAGVPNTTIFPHSAICLLEMNDGSGGVARGTGFYIGRNRILTCGHNLYGMASVDIVPGKNGQGAGSEPFGRCTVTSGSWRVPASYGGSNDATDLAVIDNVPLEAPNGAWFPVLEELNQSRPEGVVVCGYSSRSEKVPELTKAIDGFKQHMHAGYIASLGAGDSTFSYPILTLKRASGSPVYYISDKEGGLKAYVVGVHTGADTQDLNRGCRLSAAKIAWIEGRTASLALRTRALVESADDDDTMHGIDGPIPDDTATAQAQAARTRAFDTPTAEYPQASRFAPAYSGNYRASSGQRSIERVVIHITDGGAKIGGTIGWFQNPQAKVSAHYVIGQDGEVVQMVRHNDVAWHARKANGNSIGIEHVANTRGLKPTQAQYCASAALVAWLCDTYSIPVDRTHVLGHSEADVGTTHTGCPNAVWNWPYYMDLVTSRTCHAPEETPTTTQSLRSRALEGGGSDYAVGLIPQPDKNSCWAASLAMLYSFRRSMSLTPEKLANDVGASLATSYGWDLLQAVRQKYGFEMIQQPSNTSLYHTPQTWADWLASYGPLWVVIVGAPHAVVLAGIRGNLADPASVKVKILNPWDTRVAFDSDAVAFNPPNNGYQDWLPFEQFASDFGNMAEADYGNWRVLYLPVTAASAQSLGYLRRARALEDAPSPVSDGDPLDPPRVPGTVMRVLRGGKGAFRWELDRLEGAKTPRTPPSTELASGDVVIDLDEWPTLDGKTCPLPIRLVVYHGKNGAVGQIHSEAGDAANVAYGVECTLRIEDDADVGNVAALKVIVDYRFSTGEVARTELRVLGDGRYERLSQWLPTAKAA